MWIDCVALQGMDLDADPTNGRHMRLETDAVKLFCGKMATDVANSAIQVWAGKWMRAWVRAAFFGRACCDTSTTNPAENSQAVTSGRALEFARVAKRTADRHSRVTGTLAALAFITACV